MVDNTSAYTNIFMPRLHMFKGTAVHMIRKQYWAAWIADLGEHLHTEYTFASRTVVFKWDKVCLLKNVAESTPDHELFILEDNGIGYIVTIEHGDPGYDYDYILTKYDTHVDITITLYVSHRRYEDRLADIFKPQEYCGLSHLMVVHAGHAYYFSWARDFSLFRMKMADGQHVYLTDHNIKDILEFMKTSRLNLCDYVPRYTLA